MSGPVIRMFGTVTNLLGESPVWDAEREWLWWVDIRRNRVVAAGADGVVRRDWRFDTPVSAIGLGDAGLVAALADGFASIDLDGTLHRLASPPIGRGAIRFNDGKADRQGRFLSGTMQYGGQADALATLWRLDRNGAAECLIDGLRLTNAICFSPPGTHLYVADSLEAVIRRYPYDPATGAIGQGDTLFDCTRHQLVPDGATVDENGDLWVAMVLSDQIARISPQGALLDLVDLPIRYPSCPAFGGPDMATLYVTTIADSGHRLTSDHPDAGRMLALGGLGVRGIREARFALDNHTWN